jgi:hypothetical protein
MKDFEVTVKVIANNERAAWNIMDICRRAGYLDKVIGVKACPAAADSEEED